MNPPELAREISVAGWFKVSLPAAGKAAVSSERDAIELTLELDREPMYVLQYPLAAAYSPEQRILEDNMARFRDTGITRAVKKILGSSIERGEVNGTHYAQLVAQISDDHWWLARAIAKPGASSYSLMHCHGDRKFLVLATAVACEFYLIE